MKKNIKENNIIEMSFENSKEEVINKLNEEKQESETPKETKKFFTELSVLAFDYIDFKTKVKGGLKKDIIEEIIRRDIIDSFGLKENATEEEIKKAFEDKMKVFAKMQNIFK